MKKAAWFGFCCTVCFCVIGCGMGGGGSSTITSPISIPATHGDGRVMGGQQAVAGISLQLYTVGSTGYGSAATPLGSSFLTTAAGNFTFPAYTCPSGDPLVYMVGTGGQPIAANNGNLGVTNANLAMIVGLGRCSTLGSSFVNMNELTTVATVWALSPFMSGPTKIGTSSTNATGLVNAFASLHKLVDTTIGKIPNPAIPANATLPTTQMNTLASVLAACINSGGVGSAGDSATTGCTGLFNATTVVTAPTDTIAAAMNIAKNPGFNVTNINKLRPTTPVFSPTQDVNSPPTDWTLAIKYTGGGLNSPHSIVMDQSGNAWVANSGNNSVSKFDTTGAALSGSLGYTAGGAINTPYALAIDQTGNAWIANSGNNTITQLSADASTNATYSGNGLNTPKSIAIDQTGNVLVGNGASAGISGFTSAGASLPNSPFTSGGSSPVTAIVVNPR